MKWKDWDKNLRIRLLGEGLMNVLFWSFFPFMTIFFEERFGDVKAALYLVISQAFSVFASLIGGYCADRYGRKRMMVVSAFSQGGTFILFAFANSPWYESPMLTFISFSLLGVWGALYWPASHAMVADVVEEKDRPAVFAVFYTSINIAVVVGPVLGGFIFYSYRFEMLLSGAVLTFALGFVLQYFLRETITPRTRNRQKKNVWYRVLWEELSDYRVIAKDKNFLLFIVAGVLVAQTFMQLDILLAVYINDVVTEQTLFQLGNWDITVDGKKAFAFILAENGLIVVLFTVFITRVISKYKEKYIFILSSILYAIAISLFSMTNNVWVFVLLMAVFTAAELMVVGIQESFISKLAPKEMRGQYFSAASLRFTIGRMLAPLSLVIVNYAGYNGAFWTLGGLALISAIIYGWMFKRLDNTQSISQATNS